MVLQDSPFTFEEENLSELSYINTLWKRYNKACSQLEQARKVNVSQDQIHFLTQQADRHYSEYVTVVSSIEAVLPHPKQH